MKTTQRLFAATKDIWAAYSEHPFYGEWIRGYADTHYSEANILLLETTDRLTQHDSEEQL